MKTGKILFFLAISVFLFTILRLLNYRVKPPEAKNYELKKLYPLLSETYRPAVFPNFDEQLFFSTLDPSINNIPSANVKVGIIPHHLLAGKIIADFFSRLDKNKIQTVILLGPNHFEAGEDTVISGQGDWPTPFGRLLLDDEVIDELAQNNLLTLQNEIINQEPSIDALMPYLGFFLDKPRIIPIIFSRRIALKDIEELADKLLELFKKEDTILVSSVDFSHYVECEVARQHDEVTERAMRQRDYPQLLKLSNRYLDSPAALITALMLADRAQLPDFKILDHTNSCDLLNDNSGLTTSYYEIIIP